MTIKSQVERLKKGLRSLRSAVMKPPRVMSVADWADEYRRLSSSSSTGGRFKTESVEVARGPLNAVHESGVKRISVMTATQLMKTTILENTLGYFVAMDPCPIMIVQPKEDMAESFVKEKLSPMIASTPALVRAFGGRASLKTRSSDNTLKMKKFRGGFVAITSAGSPANLAMRAIRVLLLDEVDKYVETKEGNAVSIAIERTETFSHNAIVISVCSPTVTGHSQIAHEYEMSDQRRAYVACPHCDHEDYLQWKNVKWHKSDGGEPDPESTAYVCPECGVLWSEQDRIKILTTKGAIKWRQTKVFECCGKRQDPREARLWVDVEGCGRAACEDCGRLAVSNKHAGFHAPFLYSPWKPLKEDVEKFLEAKASKPNLRTFVNTRLAETFADDKELETKELDADVLFTRKEPPWSHVPDDVFVVTAGVDIQDNRIEAEFVGWGKGEESWSLGYHIMEGDPAYDEVWKKLDDLLLSPLEKADGTRLYVQAACIDSGGHKTQQVYAFCAARQRRFVMPIKGGQEKSGARGSVFPTAKMLESGKPYILGTNTIKDRIASMMSTQTPGPGYVHVPATRADEWFKEMTAEKLEFFYVNNKRYSRWKPRYQGIRNEALDCRVYAYAALYALIAFKIVKPRSLMPAGVAIQPPDSVAQKPQTQAQQQAKKPPRQAPPSRRPPPGLGGGFLGGGGRRRPPGM